tara:strand:+ start:365 stop:1411 length:1047 start_codon:yes stop_codon:yes gene_type:complete
MLIRTDVYTDDFKIPVSPKEATYRYIYLWEDPESTEITSALIENNEEGFTDVDFEESTKDYYTGDEMPEIIIEEEDEEANESNVNRNPKGRFDNGGGNQTKSFVGNNTVDLSKIEFEEIKEGEEMNETKLHDGIECGCNTKTFEKFVESQLQSIKMKAKEGQDYGLLLDQPQIDGKKIKGTLAYAGVSLNNRLYLPEELAKGHGMTVPLIVNHASTAGAEDELRRLPDKFRQGLENGLEMKVGQVSLNWEPDQLTLFYEGVVDDEFFQKEIDDADMAVSLGMYYDSDSPQVCDTECYTMIKGAEFHEVSLVYHAGFPIATIEANEALLKKKSTESIDKKDLKDINWSD